MSFSGLILALLLATAGTITGFIFGAVAGGAVKIRDLERRGWKIEPPTEDHYAE